MLCPVCHGAHTVLVNGRRLPCPECNGMGEIHCCDGLREQSDATDDNPPAEPERDTDSDTGVSLRL